MSITLVAPLVETPVTPSAVRPGDRSVSARVRQERRSNTGAAVVVNPSKFPTPSALSRFRDKVDAEFGNMGLTAPLWLVTTSVTRGVVEARAAVAAGVDVVLVAGGDGTVRTVAQELAGTPVALGLLPVGTGNLLARNLGVPLHDVPSAVRLALEGRSRAVDVGWLELGDDDLDRAAERFAFVVMAGAGFDAQVMGDADPSLKARIGPLAYLLSGIRAASSAPTMSVLTVDGSASDTTPSRGFVVGNVGRLSLGLTLMPDADATDGLLDAVSLLPRNLRHWAGLLWSVVTGRSEHRLMPRFSGRSFEFASEAPQPVEVDGDVVGAARRVRVSVQSAGLLVRCEHR